MRKGIMLCQPFETKRLEKWEPPYIIQPKLDGERCRAIFDHDGNVTMLSSEENIIASVPHIQQELELLDLRDTELDGELYTHGMLFDDIRSRVSRTVNYHEDAEAVKYHLFDVINLTDPNREQMRRAIDLISLGFTTMHLDSIKVVYTELADTLEEIMDYMESFTSDGYEGIIVRNASFPYERKRSLGIMKFKPRKSDIYRIVGWKEEVSIEGEPKDSLGALVCVSHSGENMFSVGSGFTQLQRKELWHRRDMLTGRHVLVKYQHITPGRGVPRFPIFSEIIWDLEE